MLSFALRPGVLRTGAVAALLAIPAAARPAGDEEAADPLPEPAGWYDRFVEVALSDESGTVGLRWLSGGGVGYVGGSVVVNDDDDFAVNARVIRLAQLDGVPFRTGVGLGAYAVAVDRPSVQAYSVALTGLVEYDLPTRFPCTVATDLSFAPDISTFDEGEGLLDAQVRVRVDLMPSAAAFVGYRLVEVDFGRRDIDIDRRFHVGVRLGF